MPKGCQKDAKRMPNRLNKQKKLMDAKKFKKKKKSKKIHTCQISCGIRVSLSPPFAVTRG
jgi:hypothetical protein